MIDPEKTYWFTSSSGRIELQIPGECVEDCSQSGSNDAAVAFWLRQPEIEPQMEALSFGELALELSEYGAWDDEELSDHDQNLHRILWIACGDIKDAVYSGDYVE